MKALSWVLIFAIPAVLIFWLYSRTPEGDARVRNTLRPSRPAQSGCVDPELGKVPPRCPAAEAILNAPPGKKGWLVINIGQCSSCLLEELQAWRRAAEQHGYAPVFLTVSDDTEVHGFKKNAAFAGAFLMRDPDRRFSQWLGRCFSPRAYAFDRELRLAAIQQESFMNAKDPFADPGLKRAR